MTISRRAELAVLKVVNAAKKKNEVISAEEIEQLKLKREVK